MENEKRKLQLFVSDFFNQHMPFNQLLGLTISQTDNFAAQVHFDWHDKLMGNPVRKILHGGVIAAVLDTVGSIAALLYGIEQLDNAEAVQAFYAQLPYGGTLDMRVDYLRPGKGEHFLATAQVLRRGNKVAVCRMDLHNQSEVHIATGTATYII